MEDEWLRRMSAPIHWRDAKIIARGIQASEGGFPFRRAQHLLEIGTTETVVAAYATCIARDKSYAGSARFTLLAARDINVEAYTEALDYIDPLLELGRSLDETQKVTDDRTLARLARRLGSDRTFGVVWSALDRYAPRRWPKVSYEATLRLERQAREQGVWEILPALITQTEAEPREWLQIARAVTA